MTGGPLHVSRKGAVLEVVLDRPKANAIDGPTSRQMSEVFVNFRDDPALRVAIITAAGEKFFCAGWDLKAAAAGKSPDVDNGVGGFGGLQELPNLNKPVIAAVNGMAVGGGFEWALSADIILAAEHVRFALPEIRSGTLADAATIKLPRRMPYHVAMELLFTGRWMEVEEAKRWGLVNEIVPAATLMDRARDLARHLAERPAPGLRRHQGSGPGIRRHALPGCAPPGDPAPLPQRGQALRQRRPERGRPRFRRKARSGLERALSGADRTVKP